MRLLFPSIRRAAALTACCLIPLYAHAGLFDDDEARKAILDLRTKLDAVNANLAEIDTKLDSKADKTGALNLVNQNEQLQQDIAKLRGQVEVLTNDLASEQKRQKDFYIDLDTRLRKLEPQKVTLDGKESLVDPDEQKSYDAAQAIFKSGEYKDATAAFSEFLRRYPLSGYAASVQYSIGVAYYAQRDYKNAVIALQAVLKNYPDSPKAPDALLNLASCYSELKNKALAKKMLQAVIKQYPDSVAAQTAKERLKTIN